MKSKATKLDAYTWQYRGWTIQLSTHGSRHYWAGCGSDWMSRRTLADVTAAIDRVAEAKTRTAASDALLDCNGQPCPDAHTCRHGINN
jgi:hypothetical protein